MDNKLRTEAAARHLGLAPSTSAKMRARGSSSTSTRSIPAIEKV
jgi:hypothetical protein